MSFGWQPHSKLWRQLCKQVWRAMGGERTLCIAAPGVRVACSPFSILISETTRSNRVKEGEGGFTSHFIFLLFLECLHKLQIWWMLLGSWIPRIRNDRQGSFLSEIRLLAVTWSDLNRAYLRSLTSHWPLGPSDVQPWPLWLTKYDFTFSKVETR